MAIAGPAAPCFAEPADLVTPTTAKAPRATAAPTQQEPAPFPAFLDDRRLQDIEQQARPRFEALALRRAEKLKRKAIEADVKRKAEEMRRSVEASANDPGAAPTPRDAIVSLIAPTEANAATLPTAAPRDVPAPPMHATAGMALPLLPTRTKPAPPTACAAETLASSPLPGGRVAIDIAAPCRKGELVTIKYTPYVFTRPLDADGRLRFVLDLFQGPEPAVSVVYASGEAKPVHIGPTDIDRVSKIAVIWGKPVNLDLHVHEYAATTGAEGHVWPKSPSNAEAALAASVRTQRGRGFLSFASDGSLPGHQVEVYTLWHHAGQSSGVVATALDYETRASATAGPTCGDGELAEIPFETIAFAPRRPAVRERGLITRAPCGGGLLEKARYQDDAVADLPLSLE